MKNDERLKLSVSVVNSVGYVFFWYAILGVLLYRWFVLDQSILETLDVFLVWIIATLSKFIMLAIKGIPVTYPVKTSKDEQKYYLIIVSLFTGILSVIILYFFRNVTEIHRLLGGFLLSSLGTFSLFSIYHGILYYWEKKNT